MAVWSHLNKTAFYVLTKTKIWFNNISCTMKDIWTILEVVSLQTADVWLNASCKKSIHATFDTCTRHRQKGIYQSTSSFFKSLCIRMIFTCTCWSIHHVYFDDLSMLILFVLLCSMFDNSILGHYVNQRHVLNRECGV